VDIATASFIPIRTRILGVRPIGTYLDDVLRGSSSARAETPSIHSTFGCRGPVVAGNNPIPGRININSPNGLSFSHRKERLTTRGEWVRTLLCAGVIGANLLVMADGVAAAVPVADVSQSVATRDGWHLTASLKNMTINSVPNFAATAFTREAFVSAEADANIDGNGTSPVNAGSLTLGA
jgi:hypothetical protein